MRDKPYMVINVLTNETVGWYANDVEAMDAHRDEPITIVYRPGRKKKAK